MARRKKDSKTVQQCDAGRSVTLLTGGGDRPYALGLASSLIAQQVAFDFVGSDHLEAPHIFASPFARFLNLRGDQRPGVSLGRKAIRIFRYYARLIWYAVTSTPRVFHILWNNRFETFDRTVLLSLYRVLGKRIVLTVHNVNIGVRDGSDSWLNRATLKIQYSLADHLFVHTDEMRRQLQTQFDVASERITVIPFGINSTVPNTMLTRDEARHRLGLTPHHKVLLFFGNISPYKGLEHLIVALDQVKRVHPECRLVIAGRPKGSESYWSAIKHDILKRGLLENTLLRIEYVPDADIEVFFKAADALVLPYTHVFQSGVLFLGYNFGLPAIVSDVASLRQDVEAGATGFVCRPGDPDDLASAIQTYFVSDLYASLEVRRSTIRSVMTQRHSWDTVGSATKAVYELLSHQAQSPTDNDK